MATEVLTPDVPKPELKKTRKRKNGELSLETFLHRLKDEINDGLQVTRFANPVFDDAADYVIAHVIEQAKLMRDADQRDTLTAPDVLGGVKLWASPKLYQMSKNLFDDAVSNMKKASKKEVV